MKKLQYFISLVSILSLLACKKNWSTDHADIYQYKIPPGVAVTDGTPLCGAIKGIMLTGKTYIIDTCGIVVNSGDTLIVQPGVTVYMRKNASVVVKGTFLSLGTKTQPNWFTVEGMVKNHTPGLPKSADPAYSGYWRGIAADTSCKLEVIKWTHIEFAGGAYGPVVAPLVHQSNTTAYVLLFQNYKGSFILEDSWLYGGTDDAVRVSNGKIHIFRNTFEKTGLTGGDCFNVKGGTTGTMAYNFFIATGYNGQKASNKGQPAGAPQTYIVMYNSTFVNCGNQVVPGQRRGSINFEEGARGSYYNNVAINCKVGYGVVGSPVADTAHMYYGNNYQWADSVAIANNFFTFGNVVTKPQPTDIPLPSSYLPASFNYLAPTPYDGSAAVQKFNPMFINYPLPQPAGIALFSINDIGNYNFHLQLSSPLIGKGYTGSLTQPLIVVPVDLTYGATEVTPPGIDLGCFQTNGTGNQH